MRGLCLIAMILMIVSCTTAEPYTGERQMSKTAKGSLIGAAAGAAAGALIDGSRGAINGAGIGAVGGGLFGLHSDLEQAKLRRALEGTGVRIERQGDMIRMHMAENVTFDQGSDAVDPSFFPVLDAVALVLLRYDDVRLLVIGYADPSESDARRLSMSRSVNVGKYLTTKHIAARRIKVNGVGDSFPKDEADVRGIDQPANRRVTIRLMAAR